MTRLITRLVLAMMTLPISVAIFVLGFSAIAFAGRPELSSFFLVWLAVYLFVGIYWVIIWRDLVVWTTNRVVGTIVAALLAPTVGALSGMLVWSLVRPEEEVAVLLGGGVPPIVWVLATVFIWRETAEERLARIKAAGADAIVCSVCGYNMTGLKEARCPECGAQYTLDQLYASQPAKDHATLEDD